MRLARALAVVLALGAASCRTAGDGDAPSAPGAPGMGEVQLAPGESARVDGLRVRFEGVTGDSRCPVDVQCVWEGDAVVVVTAVETSGDQAALELHTAGRFPRAATYGRYRVRLVALSPQPRQGQSVPAGQYRATLRITAE